MDIGLGKGNKEKQNLCINNSTQKRKKLGKKRINDTKTYFFVNMQLPTESFI